MVVNVASKHYEEQIMKTKILLILIRKHGRYSCSTTMGITKIYALHGSPQIYAL